MKTANDTIRTAFLRASGRRVGRPQAAVLVLLAVATLTGCNQMRLPVPVFNRQTAPQPNPYETQLSDMGRRFSRLDASNEDLHAQLAQSDRELKLARDELSLVRERLSETAEQLQSHQVARQEIAQKLEAVQASTRHFGGATLRANNSIRNALQVVDIPGLDVRLDQDVIRIEIPADQVFERGTVNFKAGATRKIQQAAYAIARHYRAQTVMVEAHADSGPLPRGVSSHQLTLSQGLAVFDQLTREGNLPDRQLAVVGMGGNHPLASNATEVGRARNRRIELVVYPDEF